MPARPAPPLCPNVPPESARPAIPLQRRLIALAGMLWLALCLATAGALLTGAFCREVVAGIEDEATRALCDAALDRALARLGA